jgi:hypothetical protein
VASRSIFIFPALVETAFGGGVAGCGCCASTDVAAASSGITNEDHRRLIAGMWTAPFGGSLEISFVTLAFVSDADNLLEGFKMKRLTLLAGAIALVVGIAPAESRAQQQQQPRPLIVGNRLGLPVEPAAGTPFEAISPNVKVYGAIYSAESCSYDAERGVIVVPNRGVPQNIQATNAWVSFINHDGSVHTARWIGVQNPPIAPA